MSRPKKPFQPKPPETCGGKNCYDSKAEAETVAAEQELRDIGGELKLAVYRCAFCGKWHLTRRQT